MWGTGLEPQITAGFTQWLSGIGGEAEKELIQVKQLWRMYQNLSMCLFLCHDSLMSPNHTLTLPVIICGER